MKVCLCFYGLNRSLQLTYNSIYDKILMPLKLKWNIVQIGVFHYGMLISSDGIRKGMLTSSDGIRK